MPAVPYLTPAEKAATLAYFAGQRRDPRGAAEPGGLGKPDPEVLPLCDRLNALDGLCTVQSCCGHRDPPPGGGDAWASEAHVWLRVSRAWHEALVAAGFDLAALRGVTGVSAHFDRVEGAVWRVHFEGRDAAERPDHALRSSAERIAKFFEGAAALAGWDA